MRSEQKRTPKARQKNDPKYVAAARDLRDKYLEQVNAGLPLPPSAQGKYDVSRALPASSSAAPKQDVPLLKAA